MLVYFCPFLLLKTHNEKKQNGTILKTVWEPKDHILLLSIVKCFRSLKSAKIHITTSVAKWTLAVETQVISGFTLPNHAKLY